MKLITLTLTAFLVSFMSYAQDTTRIIVGGKTIMVVEKNGKGNEEINVDVMLDSLLNKMDTSKTNRFEIELEERIEERVEREMEKAMRRIENEEEVEVKIYETEEGEDIMIIEKEEEDYDVEIKHSGDRSIAHWAGFEAGVNGLMTSDMSLNLENSAYDLDYSKSLFANLNILEQKLAFFKGYGGIVTGLGFNFNSFAFKENTTLGFNSDSTWTSLTPATSFRRNKLNVTYLTIPLMLEFNTSLNQDKSFHIGFGVQGGFKLLARTKQRYEVNNENYRLNVRGHYNVNPWKADAIARVGYKNFTLFANYPLTQFFEQGAGPEMYTWQVGLRIIDFG
ncbi:MAG: PorT family protein [Bacteroidia bacterium]